MLRLTCSRSTRNNLFQDLYRQFKDWEDIPVLLNNASATLGFEVTDDEFTAQIKTTENKVIASFSAYYIEEDEYGDPLYDIYINDSSEEENADAGAVEESFRNWFSELQSQIGVFNEQTEREYLETGAVSLSSNFEAKLKKLFLEYAQQTRTPLDEIDMLDVSYLIRKDSKVRDRCIELINEYTDKLILPAIEEELSSKTFGGLFEYVKCEPTDEKIDGFSVYDFYFKCHNVVHYISNSPADRFYFALEATYPDYNSVEGCARVPIYNLMAGIESELDDYFEVYISTLFPDLHITDVTIHLDDNRINIFTLSSLELDDADLEIITDSEGADWIELDKTPATQELYAYVKSCAEKLDWSVSNLASYFPGSHGDQLGFILQLP